MKPNEHQKPEGVLLAQAMELKQLSARAAAQMAGMSDARWRQIINGYAAAGAGQVVEVTGPDDTIARMARVVDVTPEQLRKAGRPEAADLLLVLTGTEAEKDWQGVGTALERLRGMREVLDGVIEELSQTDIGSSGGKGPAPGI